MVCKMYAIRRQANDFVCKLWMQDSLLLRHAVLILQVNSHTAGPGGRAVYGVGPQPLVRIAGSHPAESTNCAYIAHDSSVCERLITRTEESHWVYGSNCMLCGNLKKKRPRPEVD